MTTPLNFQQIGLVYRASLPQSRVITAEMLQFVEERGGTAWVCDNRDLEKRIDELRTSDLLIVLGGDGTIIRVARMTLDCETAILGINQGRLGFLAEIQPSEWAERFQQVLTGPIWFETRLSVQAKLWRDGTCIGQYTALNEVSISRAGRSKVIRLEAFVNDSYLTSYTADGMILSTPTGSTAYALAAGGPILSPELRNLLLIPIAPHLSLDRAIVLSAEDKVQFTVHTLDQASLALDGQIDVDLVDKDIVEIETSPHASRFLRLRERSYFHKTLMHQLGWPQNRSNSKK
ncbi:MAG: NAD(+)/NADH kinase [Chloroflexota bacterium]